MYKFLLIYFIFFLPFINASEIIKDTKKDILENTLKKELQDSKIQKDSWINPISVESTISKMKDMEENNTIKSKKILINLEQEIFKSGAILQTIKKGKNLINLSLLSNQEQKQQILYLIYKYVINLKIIEINIQKQTILIENKELEIEKKLDMYNNGLVDISELDESIIELSELKNSIEDLKIDKSSFINQLKSLSSKSYNEISLDNLLNISIDKYLEHNYAVEIKKLQVEDSKYESKITKSSYLPKIALYGSYGYDDTQNHDDNYYEYGLKISMPIDYNFNKNIQSAKLKSLIANSQFQDTKDEEKNSYKSIQEELKYLENKIQNTKTIAKRYENIQSLVFDLYQNSLKTKTDYTTISNRLKVVNMDIEILQLQKKRVFNQLFKNYKIIQKLEK